MTNARRNAELIARARAMGLLQYGSNMPLPFDTASTNYSSPPLTSASSAPSFPTSYPQSRFEWSHKTPYLTRSRITLLSFRISPPQNPFSSPFIGTCFNSQLNTLTQGSTSSQGLVGSVYDTDWESSVPQAASVERRGKGTYAALVGFHLVLNWIISQLHFHTLPLTAVNV